MRWGLYNDRGDLLATVRSQTQQGAIARFRALSPDCRGWKDPTRHNVRVLP